MRATFSLLVSLLALCAAAGADPITFKCVDGKGRVTYSNIRCEKQGLKDGGEVADRTTTVASPPPPKPAAKAPTQPAAPAATGKGMAPVPADKIESEGGSPAIVPVNPQADKAAK